MSFPLHISPTDLDGMYVCILGRDVSAGATGATAVAPKFSDALTLSPPGGADSAHHRRGRN